jgi:putative Holliday junction resolvase
MHRAHHSLAAGRYLALDYGRRRIGLAVADEMGIAPRPLLTLQRKNRREDLRRLRQIALEQGAARIIVGLPLNMDGSRGDMAEEAARFARRLERELGLPVFLFDERLSSWEVESAARGGAGRKRAKHLDAEAAAVILKDYLDRERDKEQTRQ